MFLSALLSNLHFALEIIGALAFGMVGWLAVDAFLVMRDFKTIARGIGFGLLAIAQVSHAFQFSSDVSLYVEHGLYALGLLFIVINLIQEAPVDRPMFRAILVLPAVTVVLPWFQYAECALMAAVTWLAYRQMQKEFKYALRPFIAGFALLTLAGVIALVGNQESYGVFWFGEHLMRLLGFFAIAMWVWSYLQLRIREELLFILISVSLFMAVIVSLSFSTIIVKQLEEANMQNLLTNSKVLDFSVQQLRRSAEVRAQFVANDGVLRDAIAKNDMVTLQELAQTILEGQQLGFLTITNADGDVLLRAHALSQREDNIGGEIAVGGALLGQTTSAIETSPREGFSVRSASPVLAKGKVIGVVVLGYQLDNAFADSIKKMTGLDLSIYEGGVRIASTEFERDERTRSVNLIESDVRVMESVLKQGQPITIASSVRARSILASYLPLIDAKGKVVGMLQVAKPERAIMETVNTTNRYTLLVVVVIMLILAFPLYLLTKRLGEEVV